VKGVNHIIKRNKILTHLKRLEANISFLQETHLISADHYKLQKSWVGQMYHSDFQSRSRGTAILISKNTPFCVSNVQSDRGGDL